nr:MAG TPA: hypothetical protein [Caudoviricetes sp.]
MRPELSGKNSLELTRTEGCPEDSQGQRVEAEKI